MKQLIELNLLILANDNSVIGTYSRRFDGAKDAHKAIMDLESDGFRFKDPYNKEYWVLVEVKDESQLQ